MTQQPIVQPEPLNPLVGQYYQADKESLARSRDEAIKMAGVYEEQRWSNFMSLMDGFDDMPNAEKLAYYAAKEPQMVDASDEEWEALLVGLKKYPQLKIEYPVLAQQFAMLAPWFTSMCVGKYPAQEARKMALEMRRLIKESA